MAIGTAALIGGALSAVGGVASAAIGSSAASKASAASERSAQLAAAEQRAARQQAYATLNPYVQAGLPATQNINALLGIGGTAPGVMDWNAYVNGNPDALANWNAIKGTSDGQQFNGDINAFGQYHYTQDGSRRDLTPFYGTANSQADAAGRAFDTFRNSTGYDFRVKQGMNALNAGYAGAGTIKSGAAIKGAMDYGQGMASQEFGNYLSALGNQQALGMQAGSAAAGVGTNAANNLGAIYQQNGSNQANAALARGSMVGNALAGGANMVGSILAPKYGAGGFSPGTSAFTVNALTPSMTSAMNANAGIF